MKIIIIITLLMRFAASANAVEPPVGGGFFSGSDSTLYVYWYHSQIHARKQTLMETGDISYIYPGFEPGQYAFAQYFELPAISFLTEIGVRLYNGDHNPGLPGDQYSPFRLSLREPIAEGQPGEVLRTSEDLILCGGDECHTDYVFWPVGYETRTGCEFWSIMEWSPETPSAPEVAVYRGTLDMVEYNLIGIKEDTDYQWAPLHHTTFFEFHYNTLWDLGENGAFGFIREIPFDYKPEYFRLAGYDNGHLISEIYADVDSLIDLFPAGTDSVSVQAVYSSGIESEPLLIRIDSTLFLPLGKELFYDGRVAEGYRYKLFLKNRSEYGVSLAFNQLDDKGIILPPEQTLAGGGILRTELIVPDTVNFPERLQFLVSDTVGLFNPLLVLFLHDPEATGVDDDTRPALPEFKVVAAPNPFNNSEKVYMKASGPVSYMEVYDVLGRLVYRSNIPRDETAVWDGRDSRGNFLPSGIYFVRVGGNQGGAVKKVMFLPE